MENEVWKPFPEFEKEYQISNYGNVFSKRANRKLKLKISNTGYLRVSPSVNGYREECAVHRAVAMAFCQIHSVNQQLIIKMK